MQRAATEVSLPLAAQRLRVSGEIARRMLLRGELQGRQVGGRWLVAVNSIDRFEQKRSQLEPAPAA